MHGVEGSKPGSKKKNYLEMLMNTDPHLLLCYYIFCSTKNGKRKRKLLPKNGGKARSNTWKLILYISLITYVFLNQKKVNVCEHMVDGIT